MVPPIKIAVTGAAGQISYSFLFRLASGQVFGQDVPLDLRLLEVEAALPALTGVQMELEDSAFPLLRKLTVTADANQAFDSINWAVLIGAAPRRAGMERSDLLEKNGAIFKLQGTVLNERAANDVRVLVVGNPCNTNCLIAMHNAPHIPRNRFYAMTRLDQNRALVQLAQKASVTAAQVSNMIIWGNHSSTQYPDFYHAMIDGNLLTECITDMHWLQEVFIPLVQQRGAAVIKARGSSSAASAASAIIDTLSSIIDRSAGGQIYSLAVCSEGQYQVDPGLIFSFPCKTVDGNITVLEDINHNTFAQRKLQETQDELRHERDHVKALHFIEK